ncbi:MAG: pyridoxal phosphate-dependent aminotransferase [Paracoccaceae bacterium]|nr:pyridoxal phosphate-dependent aminotransferase [Paracoccaceae bacterium]
MDSDPNGPWVAARAGQVAISAIKEMAMLSAKVEGAASLAWGLPSFQTPEPIRKAVEAQLESDPEIGMYALPDGLPELRAAVAERHRESTDITVDPDDNVMITAGNMEGVNCLLQAILDPGDEVIVTDPGFVSHIEQIRVHGGTPVFWPMDEAADWQIDLDALPGLVTDRTKAIILVSPSNPTGKIFSRDTLCQVGAIAQEHGLLVIIDDPYRYFTYENQTRYFNLASEPEFAGNVAYLFTFSKCFAMSGWRVGYMILPAHLKRQAVKLHDLTMICTPRISQVAALAALEGDPEHLSEFEAILERRRKLICERLDAVPHVFQYVKPEGAYYVFPRIVAQHTNSSAFARGLLREARVTVTPGRAFGPSGENHVRMAFCVSDDAINLAFDRIEKHFPA